MITVLVRVTKASRMIVILTASHDERFQSTPEGVGKSKNKHNFFNLFFKVLKKVKEKYSRSNVTAKMKTT